MAENSAGSPVFAGRYRFEPIPDDWDTGRTGFTHPAFDNIEKRQVVIKRADVTSPQARQHEHGLQNEAKALQELKGFGVPDLYEVNQAEYGYQRFTYLVMEYIEGIRIEREVSSFTSKERAHILFELFRLLAKTHKRGISNGDIDLKHLFWLKEKQKLVVIDWGNANVNPYQRNHQIAFDLARSAEIICALVTRDGEIPVTGSLALPEKTNLFPGLTPIPEEFYKLCDWAPRNPAEDMRSPFTALELYIAAKKWISQVDPKYQANDDELDALTAHRPKEQAPSQRLFALFGAGAAALVIVAAIILSSYFQNNGNPTETAAPSSFSVTENVNTPFVATTPVPIDTEVLITPTLPIVPTATQTLLKTPSPRSYSQIITFNNKLPFDPSSTPCWTTNPSYNSMGVREDKNWTFQVDKQYSSSDPIETDFSKCFSGKQIAAIGLNFLAQRIGINSEFGIFVEDHNNHRREYTLWTDSNDNTTYLQVKETGKDDIKIPLIIIQPIKNDKSKDVYYQYSTTLFLELNNQGFDNIYLSPARELRPLNADEIYPDPVFKINGAVLSALGNIQKIGLIGRGKDIQIILWPLIFFGDGAQ